MTTNKEKWNAIMKKTLRPPFFILLFSILIGSILIPLISYYFSECKLRQEARFELVDRIVERDLKINMLLNNLTTTIAIFHKDNCTMNNPSLVLDEQKKLKGEMNKLYLEFERNAWFWSEFVFHKAINSKLSEKKIKCLATSLTNYNESVHDMIILLQNENSYNEVRESILNDIDESSKIKPIKRK